MPSVPISQLPPVSEVSPSAYVPIDQNGVTSRATVQQIGAAAQDLTQSFVTVGSESGTLPNSRAAGATNGITRTDSGAGGTLTFSLTGQALNFFLLSTTGLVSLTGGGSVVTRALVGPGKGFTISNADGVAGNPTFSLTGGLLALEDLTGPGVVCSTGPDTFAPRTLTGTADQIDITNAQGAGGDPTFAIADDPRLPGTGGFLPPGGTTAQRPLSPPVGFTRRNTDLNVLEAWDGAQWVSQGVPGVTSVATGTGLTGGPITSTGTISIADTGVTAGTYGSASTVPVPTVNAQGQITGITTATITPASIGALATNGDASSTTVTATGATTARTLANKVSDLLSVADFGAAGNWNGSTGTDDLPAFTAAFAAVQSCGGGTLELQAGKRYRLDISAVSSGSSLFTLTSLNGVTIRGNGAEIYLDRSWTGSDSIGMVGLSGCSQVIVENLRITQQVQPLDETFTRGIVSFVLSHASHDLRFANITQTGGKSCVWCYRTQANEDATQRVQRIEVDNLYCYRVGYPIELAYSGDNTRGRNIRAEQCYRPSFVNGVSDVDLELTTRDTRSQIALQAYNSPSAGLTDSPYLRNVRLRIRVLQSTAFLADAQIVALQIRGPNPITVSGLRLEYYVENGVDPESSLLWMSKEDATGATDSTTGRGHVFEDVVISGVVSGLDAVQMLDLWSASNWQGETVRNFRLDGLTVTGSASATIEGRADIHVNGPTFSNVVFPGSVNWTGSFADCLTYQNVQIGSTYYGNYLAGGATRIVSTAGAFVPTSSTVPANGMYLPSANAVGLATGGTVRAVIDSAGALVQGYTAGLSIGALGGLSPQIQAHGTGFTAGLGACRWDAASVFGAQVTLAKSRGAIGTHGIVLNGDECGRVWFTASDGTTFMPAAEIRGWIDGTPTAGYMPGMLVFGTTATGSGSPVERMRIRADGTVTHRSNATTVIDANSHLGLRSYTVATLPSAGTAGRLIFVSDGTSNKRLAVSDGSSWRWPDGAIVS